MYAYKVRDPLGRVFDGTLPASSIDDATQQLRRDGLTVLELSEGEGDVAPLFNRRITRKEIVYVTSQLAVMVDTGITISSALNGISAQEKNPTLKRLLAELAGAVESGIDFSTALERHPKHFSKTYVALVRVSESMGTMGEMLERISGYLRRELDNRGKVRAALAYPMVMVALASAVTIFLLTYVLPQFAPLFGRKGVKLPKLTVFMMTLSDSLIHHWPWWIAGTIALIVGLYFHFRSKLGRRQIDWIKIKTPLIGPLFQRVILSRSIDTLGTMVASGVSVLEALRMAGEVAGNSFYQQVWDAARDQVTAGRQICEALNGCPLIPPTLVQMISAGEQTGRLDMVLAKVSSFYEKEVEMALKSTTAAIEPLLICVMGAVVGGIAMSLLMPIFTLSRSHG
jgi:type IV pilus assembly protein PilC